MYTTVPAHRVLTVKVVTMHRCIAILGPAIRVSYRDPSIAILKKKNTTAVGQGHQQFKKKISVTHGFLALFALFVAHTQRGLCCASFIVSFKGTFG